ncbi:MAG: DUF2062 domain-containing protein [Legionellales bacterium]|nr:DUF2062 domain-containing protein [Legionellales bacterium]
MPKHLIKKYIPSNDNLRTNKHLQIFGNKLLKNQIWNLNINTTSRAFAVGVFCAFLPIPFQMVVAAALAIITNANLPISVALVWLTNPITIPPVFYFCYRVGVILTGSTIQTTSISLSIEWLSSQLGKIMLPLIVGSLFCGIISAIFSYYFIKTAWKIQTGRKWRNRRSGSVA